LMRRLRAMHAPSAGMAAIATEPSLRAGSQRLHSGSRRRRFWAVTAVTAAVALVATSNTAERLAGSALVSPEQHPEGSSSGGSLGQGSEAHSSEVPSEPSFPQRLARVFSRFGGKEWQLCAPVEGATCHCTGTAALHTWTGDWAMVHHANGSIRCTADAFGDDPRPHFAKICSCYAGPAWPVQVAAGLNSTIARKLVPRVEIGPLGAGCDPSDDGLWTSCGVMSTRYDASVIPDRFLPMIPPAEQQDAALRKLDICHHLAGGHQAMRILGVMPSKRVGQQLAPVKAASAPVCAVIYEPGRGAAWGGRSAVFCPTDPPRCLEGSCECANSQHRRINIKKMDGGPECWACVLPQDEPAEEKSSDSKGTGSGQGTGQEKEVSL